MSDVLDRPRIIAEPSGVPGAGEVLTEAALDFLAELHERFATPLYPLVFTFIAIAFLGHARTTREARWAQIIAAFGIAVGLRVAGLTAGNLSALNAWAVGLVYALPLGAILVAAWTAHVRMSPELRSRLSFELKFPKKIMIWAGRGMQTT